MEEFLKTYKRKFNNTLSPIKAMLVSRRGTLPKAEWLSFVERTKESVINQPDQYLGRDLPDKIAVGLLVRAIFEEFLEEEVSVN
jgi:hypothetical protein